MQKTGKLEKDLGIVLYGGSFDPIHSGHLQIAQSVLNNYCVEKVIFIPSEQSPLKDFHAFASPSDRLKMLSIAIQKEERFALDSLEIDRGGTSYTSKTVQIFRERYPEMKLYWVLGEDQFANLSRWNDLTYLIQELTFLVYPRNQAQPLNPHAEAVQYEWLDCPKLNISSTQVRERCRASKSIKGLVPEGVEAFIHAKRIYQV